MVLGGAVFAGFGVREGLVYGCGMGSEGRGFRWCFCAAWMGCCGCCRCVLLLGIDIRVGVGIWGGYITSGYCFIWGLGMCLDVVYSELWLGFFGCVGLVWLCLMGLVGVGCVIVVGYLCLGVGVCSCLFGGGLG